MAGKIRLTRELISKAMATAGIPENPLQTAFILGLQAGLEKQVSSPPKSDENKASASSKVTALELALAYAPDDLPPQYSDLYTGFKYSGTYAGRNIEKIHARGGLDGSLGAVTSECFGGSKGVKHALVCSGFYVVHSLGGNDGRTPGVVPGSCETDGPLGALAVIRAFAARGVYATLYCEPHNGPVLRAGYDAMLQHYDAAAPAMAARLRTHTRCLRDGAGDGGWRSVPDSPFLDTYAETFPDETAPPARLDSLRCRSLACAIELSNAMSVAWDTDMPGPVDCLFALERLGCPYRNIRGVDISEHTEPIDALWPLCVNHPKVQAYASDHGILGTDTAALRSVAGVASDALTVGVGDGGNEVGFGKVAFKKDVSELTPGGEFAPLSVNGCYRGCDHLIASTVSNWGGTAFEAAAHVLFESDALDYIGADPSAVEKKILETIVDAGSVDGKYPQSPNSVDGMSWEQHREFYEALWAIAR